MSKTVSMVDESFLAERALEIRRWIVRMVHAATCGHPGGPLGLADIFAVLYFEALRHDPKRPAWPERDRLLVSNGHVCAVRYAAMALSGYLPEEELLSFRRMGSRLQGHPSTKFFPEVENASGSLGQGLAAAVGLALGAKHQGKSYRTYVCMSDGECAEGMTWEAATTAAAYKVPVIAFLDLNGIQIDGFTKDVCDLGDLPKKFASFGWKVHEADGHSIPEIRAAFAEARKFDAGPQMIAFRTVLGKGVSFMENNPKWHGVAPNDEQAQQALKELSSI